MYRLLPLLALLVSLSAAAQVTPLSEIQRQWAEANYQMSGKAQTEALTALSQRTQPAEGSSDIETAERLIWDGIVKSTLAGKKGGLGALSLVKSAKKSLERAIDIAPNALHGSAYTSLGALYYQVPGWPIGFGDDKKAEALLTKALSLNPDGIDSNYFYADYLFQKKDYQGARAALEKALAAPARPDRPLADAGRQAEINALLAKLPG